MTCGLLDTARCSTYNMQETLSDLVTSKMNRGQPLGVKICLPEVTRV